ncbi:MAG TPA: DUF1569 domain-containing protein [Mucilaginibacter sp.]|jgi:hypothetical protein|nr:DUF1569 domain-containing protein [Mucilaginibacter sp.]
MKSIFNADNNAELIHRINKLQEDTPALWGKLTSAQMMAHCQKSMNMALGNTKIKRHWIGRVFGNIAKRRLLKVERLDKNIPTYKHFEVTYDCAFDEEKEKFVVLIKSALTKGESGLVKHPHPYFKTFKPTEWSQLNWMHLDHHFRQFGT